MENKTKENKYYMENKTTQKKYIWKIKQQRSN